MLSFCLQIAAFASMCLLLFIFTQGLIVFTAGTFDGIPGKTVQGWRARLIGLLLMLQVPLAVGLSMFTATLVAGSSGWKIQDGTNLGLILLAAAWWLVIRQMGNVKTPPCPNCRAPLRTNQAKQCFKCGAAWRLDGDPAP